ncbi:hypothetical protein SCB49_11002 [unidentified eubacterium SCB49]|nr:hypothetical protein SCB49_11002 [unidentified eubacterium SCB49]
MPTTTILPFCEIIFSQNYMIATVNTGVSMTKENSKVLNELALDHFKDRYFVYISNRINSYSVDPNVYSIYSKNIKGYAVVSNNEIAIASANFESNFTEIPFEVFSTIEKAVSWTDKILNV